MPDNSRNPQQSGTEQDQNKKATGTQSGQGGTDQDRSQSGQGSHVWKPGFSNREGTEYLHTGTGTQRPGSTEEDRDREDESDTQKPTSPVHPDRKKKKCSC